MLRMFAHNSINLVVLDPSHLNGSLTEGLTLHVDAIFANQTIATHATSDAALARALAVILGVRCVQLVGFARFSHGRK